MYAPLQNFLSNGADRWCVQQHLLDCPGGVHPAFRTSPTATARTRWCSATPASRPRQQGLQRRPQPSRDRPAGGAVCYVSEPGYNDCVSWGNFSGNSTLTMNYGRAPPGTPAPRSPPAWPCGGRSRRAARRRWRRATTPTTVRPTSLSRRPTRGRTRSRPRRRPAPQSSRPHPDATESPGHGEEEEVQEAQAEPGFRQRRHRARQRQHSGLRGQEEVQEEAEVATRRPAAACLAVR